MDEKTRYTMNHLGDLVVEGLDRLWHALAAGCTCRNFRLNRRRRCVLKRMGERLAEMQAANPDLEIFGDEQLAALVAELREIEAEMMEEAAEEEPEAGETGAPPETAAEPAGG